ncbi:hypothetical protein NDN08_006687 [Rhodosorus marinus]|uniref:Symplekin C-terminal domain-containing protein n=1 Tax=Rhodosorus marinus TaxID=101924 RepID=A0AAV8UIB2_9RHOD|nr:hypothetical protein NDN08_006687 [Rhodosorus marinus]
MISVDAGLQTWLSGVYGKDATVQKRAIQSSLSNFWPIMEFFRTTSGSNVYLWDLWGKLISAISDRMWSDSNSLRKVSIKFVVTVIVTYASDESGRPDVFSITRLAGNHPFMNRSDLANQAQILVNKLCSPMQEATRSDRRLATPMTVGPGVQVVIINCLGEIGRLCPQYASTVVPILMSVVSTRPPMTYHGMTAIQKPSILAATKASVKSIIRSGSQGRSLGRGYIRTGELSTLGLKNMPELTQLSGVDDEQRSGQRKRPRVEQTSSMMPAVMTPFATASVTLELFKSLPVPEVVELVMRNMENLPPVVPITSATATEAGPASVTHHIVVHAESWTSRTLVKCIYRLLTSFLGMSIRQAAPASSSVRDPRKKPGGPLRDPRKERQEQAKQPRLDPRRASASVQDTKPADSTAAETTGEVPVVDDPHVQVEVGPNVPPPVSKKRTDAPPVEALKLSKKDGTRLRTLIALRILHQESEAMESGGLELRLLLLARILTSTGSEESSGSVEEEGLRQQCQEFICEDLAGRLELASYWLYAEAASNVEGACTGYSHSGDEQYRKLLLSFMGRAIEMRSSSDQSRDPTLSKLLIEAPSLPEEVMDELRRLSEDPSSSSVGLYLLGDVVLERYGDDRDRALTILLEYAICDDELLRGPAIRLLTTTLLELKETEEETERYSLAAVKEMVERKSDTGDPKSEIGRVLHLLMALVVKKPELLVNLAGFFVMSSTVDRDVILDLLADSAKQIPGDSESVNALIRGDQVPEAGPFALKLLETLAADSKLALVLLEPAKERFSSSGDVRFILPVLSFMDKETIKKFLPSLLRSMDKDVFAMVLDVTSARNPPVMLPSELMYELHVIDGVHEDAVKQALEQCFARTAVFKQEILATVLQRMVEMSPLPKLFLWTVIETVTHQPKLKSFISQSILRRLVERELWESHMLWEAFEAAAPISVPVLLQLPPTQLREALTSSDKLRESLTRYTSELRTAVPSWVVSILDSSS